MDDKKLTVSVLVWLQDAAVAAEASSVVGGAGSSGGGGGGSGGSGGSGGGLGSTAGGAGGGGSGGGGRGLSPANSLSPSPSPSASGSPRTSGGNNAVAYPCIYCSATFPSQSKQTRHILAHSLETLKFREIISSGHIANLLPPPPMPPSRSQQQQQQQQFNAAIMAAAAAAVTSSRSHHHHHHHQALHQSQAQLHHSPSASLMCPPGIESPIEGKGLAELAAAGHVSPLELELAAAAALGPNLLGSGSLASLHRSASPRPSSPGGGHGGNSLLMGGRGGGGGGGDPLGESAGSSGGSGSGSGSNSVVMCKFCGKSFPDVSTLITHLPVHTGDRPFKCEYCGKAFKLRHHMKDHCRVHTGELKGRRRRRLIWV